MMGRFWSAAKAAFYDENIHGAREIDAPQTNEEMAKGKRPRKMPNPDCRIPGDARQVSDEDYRALLAAQSAGKTIISRGQRPAAVDQAPIDKEEQRAIVRSKRDVLLRKTDLIASLPDYTLPGGALLDSVQMEELIAYRAALRALPATLDKDAPLASVVWPEVPAFLEGVL